MQEMMSSLLEHPLFVLFGILAAGLLLGQISVRGISLGSSGVLFAALAAGHFGLHVPEGITGIGTALFVYCVGLGVGNRFFGSLKSQGSRLLLLSVLVVGSAGGLALLLGRVLGLSAGVTAGLFAGACTSTPGLAAALEAMAALELPPGAINIGYGVAYPFGVVGVVLFVQLLPRLLKQSLDSADSPNQDPERIVTRVVRIENAGLEGRRILSCMEEGLLQCRVTRILKNDILVPLSADDAFADGMRVFVVGTLRKVHRDVALLGRIETGVPANHRLMGEMAEVIMLEPAFSNKTLRELDTLGNYGIVISRITRLGDIHCRYGGDEFVLVLKRMVSPETAMKKCVEICRSFHDFLTLESLPVACSGGIILCGEDERLSAELIERADRARYRAKRENKGGCCLWSAEKDG